MGMYSSGGGQQTSTTKVEYSPQEQAARDRIFAEAGTTYDRAKAASGGAYTGPRVVGPTDSTQGAWTRAAQAGNTIDWTTDRYDSENMKTLMMGNAEDNPYLQGSIRAAQRPLIDQFNSAGGTMATIRNNSVANGTFGGSRQGIAEGIAARGLNDKLGDISATMANDNYKMAMMQRNDAVRNMQGFNTARLMAPQLLAGIGKDREAYMTDWENQQANIREWERNGMWEPLNNLANVIYGGSNGTQSTTSQLPKGNSTQNAIGTIGSLAMMAAMFS